MSASARLRAQRHRSIAAAIGFVLAVIGLASPIPASAWPPTTNGRLAFDHADGMVTANPDGTRVLALWPAGCCAIWSPDGTKLAVADLTPDGRFSYALINPDGTGRELVGIEVPDLNVGVQAWSPDGVHVASEGEDEVNPANDGIYIHRAVDGGGLVRIVATPSRRNQVGDYSPDGSRLVFIAI